MSEIEILVSFDNTKEEVLKILEQFEYIGDKENYDTYYIDPLRDDLKPEDDLRLNSSFRIRRDKAGCYITYKKQHFDGKTWLYSSEHETHANDYKVLEEIVGMLGYEELIVVHNKRRVYHNGEYEICFEEVMDLGIFLEVEKVVEETGIDIEKIKDEIRKFISMLGLNNVRELNVGKNQMLLAKKLGKTDLELYI